MNQKINKGRIGFCAALAFCGSMLQAEDPVQNLEEAELVGKEQQVEILSLESNDVTLGDIKAKQPDDIAALFDKSLAVDVNGGKAQAQQIFINNIESTLANVTIDGATQATNMYHHASAVLIEPELLKSVEVVAGAGSALDGAGALAGAIRFETVNAYDLLNEGETFGGLSKVTGYHNGDGFKFSQSVFGEVADNWGVLVSGSYVDRDEFDDGDGVTIENSAYERTSALAKLTGLLDDSQKLEISYEYIQEEFDSYNRVNVNHSVYGGPPGPLQEVNTERNTVAVNYDLNPEDIEFLNLETTVFYTDQEFERTETNELYEMESIGIDLRNTSDFDLFGVTYGLDYREDEAESPTADVDSEIFGLYAQATAPITAFAEISAGARFDDYEYNDAIGQKYESDEVSPNVSFSVFPIEGLSITASYAEAYRGVSIREVYFIDNPWTADAKGEEADTYKLEFVYDNGFLFASGAIFEQEIKNFLDPSGNSWTGEDSNADIKSDGYELKIGARKDGFYGSVGVTYSEPELDGYDYDDDWGIVVAGRRWIGDFGYVATHSDGSFFWRAGWFIEYREGVDEEPLGRFPAIAEKDSYVLHNFSLSLDPPAIENLTLSLNVDNVFDKEYQDHTIYTTNGLNSPGRSIRLSGSYKF